LTSAGFEIYRADFFREEGSFLPMVRFLSIQKSSACTHKKSVVKKPLTDKVKIEKIEERQKKKKCRGELVKQGRM